MGLSVLSRKFWSKVWSSSKTTDYKLPATDIIGTWDMDLYGVMNRIVILSFNGKHFFGNYFSSTNKCKIKVTVNDRVVKLKFLTRKFCSWNKVVFYGQLSEDGQSIIWEVEGIVWERV